MKLFLVALIISLSVTAGITGSASAGRAAAPPGGLTASGRVLWDFEALLRQTFGSHYHGCVRALNRYTETFTTDRYCATHPAAATMYYSFTFARPARSPYHLVERTFPAGAFGNYPEPIRIESNYVACDPAGQTFLISYGDTLGLSANLACLKPNP